MLVGDVVSSQSSKHCLDLGTVAPQLVQSDARRPKVQAADATEVARCHLRDGWSSAWP